MKKENKILSSNIDYLTDEKIPALEKDIRRYEHAYNSTEQKRKELGFQK